jgi:hypothetical protein
MNTRKIMLAATTAMLITGIASPAFADGDLEANEALLNIGTISQIQPASQPQTYTVTVPKTLAEQAFDLTDKR